MTTLRKITFSVFIMLIVVSSSFAASYEYDSLNRLVKATYDDGTKLIYSYDSSGNRTQKIVSPLADINISGGVDFADFANLAAQWLDVPGVPSADIAPWPNIDNLVDYEDLDKLTEQWLASVWRGVYRFYFYDLSSDSSWTTEGEWTFGQPTGNGDTTFGYPDPTNGYSGSNVYGVNLSGDYSTAVGGPYYLTSGPFDCSSYEAVEIMFYRWLNGDYPPYVKHKIEVSNNGTDWNIVWEQSDGELITDNDWQPIRYDISSTADGKDIVYIRWSYEILQGGAFSMSGWNIDDIQLWGTQSN